MDYEGQICRAPMERASFMLPIMVGCSYNKCKFCNLFRHLKYRVLPIEQVEDEVKRVSAVGGNPRKVFFGDHQPGFSRDINEAFYDDDGSAEYVQRVYRTPYLIWANYDVAGSGRFEGDEVTCTAYLSALFMDSIGAPLSDYQMMQMVASRTVPAINLYGFSDAEGNEYLFDDTSEPTEDGAVSSASEQNAPQECLETIDLLERAQYQRFIDR